jgi:hypothetical protein
MSETKRVYSMPKRSMLALASAAIIGAYTQKEKRADKGDTDSPLLILCSEFHRTQAELDSWYATGFELEPANKEGEAYRLWNAENGRFFYANHDVYTAIIDMPAKTLAGIAAKSKVLAVHMDRVVADREGSMDGAAAHEVFAYKLAQNTAQFAGGAV